MKKATAYLCMAYRGDNGDLATEDEIRDNIGRAMQIGVQIRQAFPESLDLWIPHEKQETAHRLWKKKYVDSENILEVCCDILLERDFAIPIAPLSAGMIIEMAFAYQNGVFVIRKPPSDFYDVFNDELKQKIAQTITQFQGD